VIAIALLAGSLRADGQSFTTTTFAGAPEVIGSFDGQGREARFAWPLAVAVDAAGTVYVGDTSNGTIRKISPSGAVTTLAGLAGVGGGADGRGDAARFRRPFGVAVDAAGYVYVADVDSSTIRKISPAGDVTTLAGLADTVGASEGRGAEARFNNPAAVAVDASGTVFVADTANRAIRKITPAGDVTTFAKLDRYPCGVVVSGGNVYVTEQDFQSILKIAPNGGVTTLAGGFGVGSADGTGTAATFARLFGITADGAGNLYVADVNNSTIRKVTPAGVVTTLAGLAGSSDYVDGAAAAARFAGPFGVVATGGGDVYVADTDNHVIRRVSRDGVVSTLAGSGLFRGGSSSAPFGGGGSVDGPSEAARFWSPLGLASDAAGMLYTTELGNQTIRKITPAGVEPHGRRPGQRVRRRHRQSRHPQNHARRGGDDAGRPARHHGDGRRHRFRGQVRVPPCHRPRFRGESRRWRFEQRTPAQDHARRRRDDDRYDRLQRGDRSRPRWNALLHELRQHDSQADV
jgi:sugar lactone lactonase YvrE